MIPSAIEKLFEFILPEGNCECCGLSCKTALCQSCKEELKQEMDAQNNFTEEPAETTPSSLPH